MMILSLSVETISLLYFNFIIIYIHLYSTVLPTIDGKLEIDQNPHTNIIFMLVLDRVMLDSI